MSNRFWYTQQPEQQQRYIELLQVIGSLSHLFSDSKNPYLYYRAHENLFCEVFNAKNLSRGDVSYDAIKNGIGIGLKTFLQSNGNTFQKVAEFNADSHLIRELSNDEEVVHKVAELRNKRLTVTKNATEAENAIYHLITRDEGVMNIVETPMDQIDINSIKISKKQGTNTIHFTDKYHDYSFSKSKNTLLKRFNTKQEMIIQKFNVEILEDPFAILSRLIQGDSVDGLSKVESEEKLEHIILPLYSTRDGEVPLKSGLNQWNASGRVRHPDEVYIPIPSWIHTTFPDFFVYSKTYTSSKSAKDSPIFDVELPNQKKMQCKVAQQGGKALMSNPNKELGHWILREVLQVRQGTLVTMDMLHEIGIDSVKLSKRDDDHYVLDFMETGSFEEFEMNNKF
ncbi:NgoFVII family restriction endonuclease [Aerococcaceae bacterium DSM 111020]|nr:NgoFVII family restriction endonuclease [Aerococcaceae bacterium DSM 111020]